MKKLFVIIALLIATSAVSANSIRYFTRSQAARVVSYLNAQDELMIYCGYEYEIETYVIISDVWAERFNSAYYEVWIYGFDAYTGDEIYMPLDLNCVWLFSGHHVYSAARYLRFRTSASVPTITWYVPTYNHFTRIPHRHGYVRTYHYDVHTYGWMPPVPPPPGHHPAPGYVAYPPYYTRTPQTPAPRPENVWTPGADKPIVVTGTRGSSTSTTERPTTRTSTVTPTTTTGSSSRGGSSSSATTGSSSRGGSSSSATTGSSSRGKTTTTETENKRGKDVTPSSRSNSRDGSNTTSREKSSSSRGSKTSSTRGR